MEIQKSECIDSGRFSTRFQEKPLKTWLRLPTTYLNMHVAGFKGMNRKRLVIRNTKQEGGVARKREILVVLFLFIASTRESQEKVDLQK